MCFSSIFCLFWLNRARGIETRLLTPDECKDKFPLIEIKDLEGGIWVPHDGTISVAELLQTFVGECRKNQVPIIENCEVTKVITKASRGGHYSKVYAIETTQGVIECDYFVNCAGIVRYCSISKIDFIRDALYKFFAQQRSHEVGCLSKPRVKIPIHSCEHHYLITKPFGLSANLPIIRDYDGSIFVRQFRGGILLSGFEKRAKPIFHESTPPGFECKTLEPDLDHFCELK